MSRPTSAKVRSRPTSGKDRTGANGDVVSYEDLLVAQYLDELRKSPPYTKPNSKVGPSPYLQRLASTHVIPTPTRSTRTRPQSASAGGSKPKISSKFIADHSIWDPATPREAPPRRKRPVSAPVYKRPPSAAYGRSRPTSAKSSTSSIRRSKPLYKRQPYTIVVTAFKNGTRDVFSKVAAPTIKVLLEMCTEKLELPHAARRVFLDDGTEVFTPKEIVRDAEVYISMGETYKDPFKGAKQQSKIQQGALWTMNGLRFSAESKRSHPKVKMSKRFRSLTEQSRRRVLIYKNGNGTEGVEIVADPNRFDDFLVAATAKLDLGSYARVLYDWEGNEINNLEEAPVLDQCLQTWTTPVLGPLWVSQGQGFSPKGVHTFLSGLINYTKSKLKEAKHYLEQLHLAKDESTRDKVVIVSLLSMGETEIDNTIEIVHKDIEDFSNALNRLKEQQENVQGKASSEESEGFRYTLKHIDEFDMDHRMVGQRGVKLKVYENGTYDEPTTIYFNLTQARKGLDDKDDDKLMARLLDQCSGNHVLANPKNNTALKAVAQKLYNQYGQEITKLHELEDEQEVWLSFGEPFKNPFTFCLGALFDKARPLDLVGLRKTTTREQLMAEDISDKGMDRPSSWEAISGLPEDMSFLEMNMEEMEPMEREHTEATIKSGEVDIQGSFLRCKKNPGLLLYPEAVMDIKKGKGGKDLWPADAQIWVISKGGYIYNKAMPQLVLGVSDFGIKTELGHPTMGKGNTIVEGYSVTLQKKESGHAAQQWRFTKDGFIYAQVQPELFLTYVGARFGDDDTHSFNQAEGGHPLGQKTYIAVCEKLDGREARAQRWAIKQERFENLGQWKHTHAENPEWNKKAYSWPVKDDGEINENYDWPMEGYFIPYAPPLKKSESRKGPASMASLRLIVLKNGVRDVSQACAVVGPDLTNMRKDLHAKNKNKKKGRKENDYTKAEDDSVDVEADMELLRLEFTLFLERCTSLLNLPFAARRLYDENGQEQFTLQNLSRDQLVYVSCGEAWTNPQLSKAEQQRRYLLSNLASDVNQIRQFVALRDPQGLVLEVEGAVVPGSRLVINYSAISTEEAEEEEDAADMNGDVQAELAAQKQEMEKVLESENLTAHELAHLKAEERHNKMKRPWEREGNDLDQVAEVNGEAAQFTNKDMYQRFRPKSRSGVDNVALERQKFFYDEGHIVCKANTNLVLGVEEHEGRATEIALVKRRPDDIHQRWIVEENGIIQSKHNPQLVLSVSMPSTVTSDDDGAAMTYAGCQVTLQPRKLPQFGRANQRWHFDPESGIVHAFHTDQVDMEITAANRTHVCTYAVMGANEIDQPGYIAEMQVEKGTKPKKILVCSACARAMRGRHKLEKLRDSLDFACAMGNAKELGIKQIGSFKCLNGKVDLSTFEAEHTQEEWEGQLERLRDEMSVRAIAKEISAARVPYTVKVLAYRNGEGRMKPAELVVGSSVLGILEQCTYRLGMNIAGRRLYTVDGTIILDLDDLVDWVRDEYVRQAREQMKSEAKAKRKTGGKVEKAGADKNLMSKVDLDEEEEEEGEDGTAEASQDDGEEYLLGYDAQDRQMLDSWSKYMALPNPDEAIGLDGYITQWNFFAKKAGIIFLQILRPHETPKTYTLVDQVKIEVKEPGDTTVDLTSHPMWRGRGMEVSQGDLLSLYWPGQPMVPYDLDSAEQGQLLYFMPEGEPEKGQRVQMDHWMEHGGRKYSLNATIVPRFAVGGQKGKSSKKSKSADPQKKKESGPHVEPPPVEMILRYPIEVWVSTGEPFVKPEKVEQRFVEQLQQREERAAVAYELDKEKHILRQMQGRRFDELNPGDYRMTMNPNNPVLIEGNWQEPTPTEQEKHDIVHQLQTHLAEVKAAQRKQLKVCNAATTRRLYPQPNMKRILVFPNGESLMRAQYVWGESLIQIIANATTRLSLRKAGKYLYQIDGQLISDFKDIEKDQLLCVATAKVFQKPKDAQQNIEVKANWGRARKRYGPQATDIVVATQKNPTVDVDAFGPSEFTDVPSLTYSRS